MPAIGDELRSLLDDIKSRAPSAPVFLNSVLPRTRDMSGCIRLLNELYRQIAAETATTYVNAWSDLVAADGAVRPEFTSDGHHLNGLGYRAWVEVLRPHLEGLG